MTPDQYKQAEKIMAQIRPIKELLQDIPKSMHTTLHEGGIPKYIELSKYNDGSGATIKLEGKSMMAIHKCINVVLKDNLANLLDKLNEIK